MTRRSLRLLAVTAATACAVGTLVPPAAAASSVPLSPSFAAGAAGSTDPETTTPQRVTDIDVTLDVDDPVDAATQYLRAHVATFGIDVDSLTVLGTTANGRTETVRFAQTVGGVPVFGAQYLVHLQPEGTSTTVLSANGTYYTELDVDVVPEATQEQAVAAAEHYVGSGEMRGFEAGSGAPEDSPELSSQPQGLVVLPTGNGILAHQVTVHTVDDHGTPVAKEVMVDADAAWPLLAYDAMHAATTLGEPVEGTGVLYDGSEVPLQLTVDDGGTYAMEDASRGPVARTYDGRGYDVSSMSGSMPPGTPLYTGPSSHFDGDATEAGVVDAHVNAGHVLDYFASLGRDSIDGAGGDVTSVVGVTARGGPFINAFWDGTKMVYGAGDDEYRTMSADLDVVAHEMTHGVITNSADLVYAYQSGALNEAVADYFGNAVDVTVSGTSMDDPVAGLIGEDLCRTLSPSDCAMRDLNDGTTMDDYMGLVGEYDSGGVHYDSTIFSGALWDIREALGADVADRIVYTALTEYMTPLDDFVAGREAVVQAARDLEGSTFGMGPILKAFNSRGIGQQWAAKKGDVTRLLDDVTSERTGGAAGGGWWVWPSADEPGEPYSLYAGRTDGKGEVVKISGPVDGDRFNMYPATDGEWVVWWAWGGDDARLWRAPLDGSGEPEELTGAINPSNTSVDGDWISWTVEHPVYGVKQWYMNAATDTGGTQVDNTYHKQTGFGSVQDGSLYYLRQEPYGTANHQHVVRRDLETGEELAFDEVLYEDPVNEFYPFAGLLAPRLVSDGLVIAVDQHVGGEYGLWKMSLDGSETEVIVDEQSASAPLIGEYDATDEAVTFEHWPGTSAPRVYQVGADGGDPRLMSCTTGQQYRVVAAEGTRALWLDGSFGSTSLVTRDKPRQNC